MIEQGSLLDQLSAVDCAAAHSVLGEVIRLAAAAPVLTEEQLRFRLLALAECVGPRAHAVKDTDDAGSCRQAVVLEDPGADLAVAGVRGVRLPASGVEPVDGLTPAARVVRLPVRVPGAHLHPQLRCPPSWAGPSGRAGGEA